METIKIFGDYKLWTVNQTQLGKILGVSQPRINQLIDEKIVLRDEGSKSGAVFLIDSMRNFYLTRQASTNGEVDFWKEKALNERAKRETNELRLARERGELYEAAVVEEVIFEVLTNFRNKLSGIPAKLSPQLEGKPVSEIYNTLSIEVEEILKELSSELEGRQFVVEVEKDEEDTGMT